MKFPWGRALLAGWVGSFISNALLGALFSSPWVSALLYDPTLQSPLFIELTPQRDLAVSIAGLVLLSGLHGLLFALLQPSLPGRGWVGKGLAWGGIIWAMHWLFQEWFIYITLLREPVPLALFELVLLLLPGALLEGLVIARLLVPRKP